MLRDEDHRYLASLPRATLAQRVRYWEIRDSLEAARLYAAGPRRVRPYAPTVVYPDAASRESVH